MADVKPIDAVNLKVFLQPINDVNGLLKLDIGYPAYDPIA
jgi:hypothetical protein